VAPIQGKPVVNRLLAALPLLERRRMLARCDTVDLAQGAVVYAPGQPLTHAYFPLRAFISLVMPMEASDAVEVGLVGSEGMVGIPLALGVNRSPVRAVVQGGGSALRVDAKHFCATLGRSRALQQAVDRYVFVHLTQLAQTVGCTRFHFVEARLARWLLMTQDRAHADSFHITHEFLSVMLGVRRVGVTKAAGALQKRKLIHYSRGDITVLDRTGLRAVACACYTADRLAYERTFNCAGGRAARRRSRAHTVRRDVNAPGMP
jgi:CRP-like cAMP-binding protein